MESSCCLRASSASLLGENILLCRVLLGGSVVGTANTPASESVDPSRERGRLRPPEWVTDAGKKLVCHVYCTLLLIK